MEPVNDDSDDVEVIQVSKVQTNTSSTVHIPLDEKNQDATHLLSEAHLQECQAPSTAQWIAGLAVGTVSVATAVTVLAPFANLSIYLFEDGIQPVYDNSTCIYNTTNIPTISAVSADGWQDYVYTAGLAFVPAVTGLVSSLSDGGKFVINKSWATWKQVGNCWRRGCAPEETPDPEGYESIQIEDPSPEGSPSSPTCLQRSFNALQRFSHSWPVTIYNGLFWSSYYLNFIGTTFVENYRDDPTSAIIYTAIFGGASVPLTWYLFNHLTGLAKNADNSDNGQLRARVILKELRKRTRKDNWSENTIALARAINDGSITSLEDLKNAWAGVVDEFKDSLDERLLREERRVKNAYYGSLGIQFLNFPVKLLAQGSMFYKLGWLSGLSPDTAFKASLPVAALISPLSFLGALREQSLVQYDLYQLPQYFSLPQSAHAAAIRLGNLAAAGSTFFYLATPTWYFFQRDILYNWFCHAYFIPDLHIRAPLAALFCAGPVWVAGRQFFDRQYERIISKAFEMGDCCLPDAGSNTENELSEREKRQFKRNLDRLLYLLVKNKYELPEKETGELLQLLGDPRNNL